jgi:hypothetical protein
VLFYLVCYAVIFMILPMIVVNGRAVLKLTFLIPLLASTIGISTRAIAWPNALWPTSFLTMPCLLYLHRRFDLSQLGFRSKGWSGDGVTIVLMGLLSLGTVILPRPSQLHFALSSAVVAALDRLFLNPASSVESLFYFGFLEERILLKCGRWLIPILIGLMYTAHEMSNPEYWYSGLQFGFVLVGVIVYAALYVWRRSFPVIWAGDGLGRFLTSLV